jgi:hypothetical protein
MIHMRKHLRAVLAAVESKPKERTTLKEGKTMNS